MFPGFQQRLQSDLTATRPADSQFAVHQAEDPVLDAWKGMRLWSNSPEFGASCITKRDYEENGHDYLQTHYAANPLPLAE
jgi:actin-related protein 5